VAVEGAVEAELVVSGDHDLVAVRLRGQPLVELANLGLEKVVVKNVYIGI
jgi:hypothetical protein